MKIIDRAALSHPVLTGISREHLGGLIEELADPWLAQQESRLRDRRGGRDRLRAEGAGPDHALPFVDRVIATLVIMRLQLPHAALGVLSGVDRSTITRSVHEIRPCWPSGGSQSPSGPVPGYAPWPMCSPTPPPKPTVISDGDGRLLWTGAIQPGRMHDVSALRTEGIEDLLRRRPDVKARVDSGYWGLARDFPGQVTAPPKKPGNDATAEEAAAYEQARHQQSSQRICVEHAIAEPKQWRPLQRWTGRRDSFEETFQAVAGLVSDRTAKR